MKRDDLPAAERLRVTEIFRSLQGEADAVGWPTVFVRLTCCPLHWGYCDTAYAFHGGEWWTIAQVLDEVARLHAGARGAHVCLTGGEPLAQPDALPLLAALCDAGWRVSLETWNTSAARARSWWARPRTCGSTASSCWRSWTSAAPTCSRSSSGASTCRASPKRRPAATQAARTDAPRRLRE